MAWVGLDSRHCLNLIHHWLIEQLARWTAPAQIELYQKVERMLTGALGSHRTAEMMSQGGPTPPPWWFGDEDATASTLAAMAQLGAPQ